jgi:hypothetical protein
VGCQDSSTKKAGTTPQEFQLRSAVLSEVARHRCLGSPCGSVRLSWLERACFRFRYRFEEAKKKAEEEELRQFSSFKARPAKVISQAPFSATKSKRPLTQQIDLQLHTEVGNGWRSA